MEEDKKIEVYTGDSLSNTIPTSNIQEGIVLKGEDALRSQVQADQETQAAVERNKEEDKGFTGTLSDFGSYVGKSLKNFATEFPNKIEETYNDPKRRFALMLSLKTIDEASRYKPLTEARGPLGQFAKNVTDVISEDVAQRQKTRKLDIEDIKATAALMKAKQGPNRMYASPAEKAMEKDIENFQKTEDIRLGSKNVLEQRFNLMQAAATKGQTLPTGLVEDALLPVKEVLLYLKPEDKNRYEKLLTDYTGKDINRMSLQDQVTFQQELNSLTTQAAIGYAKNLYPVSEKDLEQLFKGFGSGRLTGEALTRLIASQKATDEFADLNAKTYFDLIKKDPGNLQAKLDARKIVESQLKTQNEKLANPETLKKLYGIDDPKQATNFQLSTAKYYSQIAPTIPKDKDINLYSSIRETREKDVIQQKQIGDQILKEFNQSRKPVK
jgi:hypothetical protein